MDIDSSDLFVHYEDLRKAGMSKEMLKMLKGTPYVKFAFECVSYFGKYNLSRKAVNIEYYYEKVPYMMGQMAWFGENNNKMK